LTYNLQQIRYTARKLLFETHKKFIIKPFNTDSQYSSLA
jgi:hypothetical protein